MKKINETLEISQILNDNIFDDFKKDKMSEMIKRSTIFSFWGVVVGKKFSKFSRPVSIKSKKLFVSAKSPVIIQELNLLKDKILKKLNSYSIPLGIEIKDIVFDYKNFSPVKLEDKSNEIEDKPVFLNDEDISKVPNDEGFDNSITKNIKKIAFLNDNQKDVLIEKIIKLNKAKKLQDRTQI